jgi:outer membrane protein
MRAIVLSLVLAAVAAGESRTLTLKEAVDLALKQNPDLTLTRLDEQKAQLEVRAVAEPWLPRVVAGSGLAYTNGFPTSIEGSAPSIFQVRGMRTLYNAPQSYMTAKAREEARGAAMTTASMREEVALRTAMIYLDLERVARAHEFASRQLEQSRRIEAAVRMRVAEGRELEIEGKRAAVNVAKARQRLESLEGLKKSYSQSLALVLGLNPADPLEPALEQRRDPPMPESEDAAVESALKEDKQLAKLASDLLARNMEARSFRVARRPKVDLIADYSLLGKFNNYEQYFSHFQRSNFQIGASIAFPLFPNSNDEARAAQSDVEARRLRIQLNSTRSRIEADSRKAWQQVQEAETAREVTKMDLDLAREQVSVSLAQQEEGRASPRQLEEARFAENERWLAFYDACYELERSRYELLRRTGQLTAALR